MASLGGLEFVLIAMKPPAIKTTCGKADKKPDQQAQENENKEGQVQGGIFVI